MRQSKRLLTKGVEKVIFEICQGQDSEKATQSVLGGSVLYYGLRIWLVCATRLRNSSHLASVFVHVKNRSSQLQLPLLKYAHFHCTFIFVQASLQTCFKLILERKKFFLCNRKQSLDMHSHIACQIPGEADGGKLILMIRSTMFFNI